MGIMNREARKYIEKREDFTTDSKTITGVSPKGFSNLTKGKLSTKYDEMLRSARSRGTLRYVVLSYETPVAWLVEEWNGTYWVEPQARYSRTTTVRHMPNIRPGYGDIDVHRV